MKRPAKEWVVEFNAIGVPAGPILSVSEVLDDAAVKEREMIATVRAEGEEINVVTGPAKIDGTKPRPLSYPLN